MKKKFLWENLHNLCKHIPDPPDDDEDEEKEEDPQQPPP